MDISWKLLGVGIGGQLAGHGVGWYLGGATIAQITSPESLMAVGLSLGSEFAVLAIGNDGISSLLPNVAQVGAVAGTRGITMEGWSKDPQVMGAIGSSAAKTLYVFQN